MIVHVLRLIFALAVVGNVGPPGVCDLTLPAEVRAHLDREKEAGWRVVTERDLAADDAAIWMQLHGEKCPGIVRGDFEGSDDTSFVVSLIRAKPSGSHEQKLLLLRHRSGGLAVTVVVPPTVVVNPLVLWKRAPGSYRGVYEHRAIAIATESFVFEKLEAAATQYYIRDGTIHNLLISD